MTTTPIAGGRADRIAALPSQPFDVLVIGGGITGCGVARDAALRGFRVALVEKDDFAGGTSSRSSRLIHGGLRYLEHGQVHLVFESSMERRRLLRLAPHLVHPLDFTWPVYRGARVPRWKLEAGLILYDALSLFHNVRRHRRLSAAAVTAREPRLRRDGLRGGASYFDASTDDARLTLANAIGAGEAGATVVNHAEVVGLLRDQGRIAGASVRDRIGASTLDVHARVVVNASGPWSDRVTRLDQSGADAPSARAATVRGSKGVHITVPRDRLGNHEALTLLSPTDGRVFFVLPDDDRAIVGTTDTYTSDTGDDVRPTREDVRYLLDSANAFFPDAHLSDADVVSAWAGIRPLVSSAATNPSAASREHAIATSEGGLVSVTGGKLTTYRIMAAEVVDVVAKQLGRSNAKSTTATQPLPGGDMPSLEIELARAAQQIGDPKLADRLVRTYGSRWPAVWSEIRRDREGQNRLSPESIDVVGQLRYAIDYEMACTLGDLLIRRTHIAFAERDHGRGVAQRVSGEVGATLGWDQREIAAQLERYAAEVDRIFTIRE